MSFLFRTLEETNALVRGGMVHLLSGPLGLYVINEFPKSGGTWVGQMLGRALGVPFPRNRLPAPRPSIMHGHYLNPLGMKNVVVPWRDGRDVMVSWYHQCLFPHELHNEHQVRRARRDLVPRLLRRLRKPSRLHRVVLRSPPFSPLFLGRSAFFVGRLRESLVPS
jgi:hypothetical protein